jgi:hypothetical protein
MRKREAKVGDVDEGGGKERESRRVKVRRYLWTRPL